VTFIFQGVLCKALCTGGDFSKIFLEDTVKNSLKTVNYADVDQKVLIANSEGL
jgi:hypothetical protein